MKYSDEIQEALDILHEEAYGWASLEDIQLLDVWEDEALHIQHLYESAIGRTSSYVGDLYNHILNGYGQVVKVGESYLAGQVVEDARCFVISHFAPASLRDGTEMLKHLPFPAVAAVPDRQADMLMRIGWRYICDVPQLFAGALVMKHVMASPRCTQLVLTKLMDYYRNENEEA